MDFPVFGSQHRSVLQLNKREIEISGLLRILGIGEKALDLRELRSGSTNTCRCRREVFERECQANQHKQFCQSLYFRRAVARTVNSGSAF
jgi:hypothetical protein